MYESLKKIWKKLGLKGQVKNFSSVELWVVNTDNGTIARKLPPGFRTPPKVDIDGFKRVVAYHVTGLGWIKAKEAFELTCYHEIDNARPVFPKSGSPYIRTRRDPELFNNISAKGRA